MTQLTQYSDDLKYYSKTELTYGHFLFLTHDRQILVVPKSYELFRYFVIYQKNFCEDNENFIQNIYEIYKDICINKKQVTNNKWLSKTSFNVIHQLSSNIKHVQYYIDRGYSEDTAKEIITLQQSKKWTPKTNKWLEFISTLELVPRKLLPKSQRINSVTGNYYTQDEIDSIKKQKILKEKKNSIDLNAECYKNSIIKLLYDNNGMLRVDPVTYEVFKSYLIEEQTVNPNNVEFLENLYNIYVQKFKDYNFLIIPNYYKYYIFFNFKHLKGALLTKDYWLCRGYSYEETEKNISDIQKKNAITKSSLISKYGEKIGLQKFDEYIQKRLYTREINKKNNPLYGIMYSKTIDPSTGTYYRGSRLLEKRRETCARNFYKATLQTAQRIKEGKLKTVWQKEYWIQHGYTEEEAINNVLRIMPKTNIEWFIKKYGEEEGTLRYNKRIEKYKKIMQDKPLEEKLAIIKKRAKKSHKVSKTSVLFFTEVLTRLQKENIQFDNTDVYMNTNEYYIYDRELKTIYFYDFCIPKIKIMVEFNGIKYHPLPTLSENELKNWKSLFYNVSGTYQRARDLRKEEIAISKGFNFLTVWDNDEIENSLNNVITLIKNNLHIYDYNK